MIDPVQILEDAYRSLRKGAPARVRHWNDSVGVSDVLWDTLGEPFRQRFRDFGAIYDSLLLKKVDYGEGVVAPAWHAMTYGDFVTKWKPRIMRDRHLFRDRRMQFLRLFDKVKDPPQAIDWSEFLDLQSNTAVWGAVLGDVETIVDASGRDSRRSVGVPFVRRTCGCDTAQNDALQCLEPLFDALTLTERQAKAKSAREAKCLDKLKPTSTHCPQSCGLVRESDSTAQVRKKYNVKSTVRSVRDVLAAALEQIGIQRATRNTRAEADAQQEAARQKAANAKAAAQKRREEERAGLDAEDKAAKRLAAANAAAATKAEEQAREEERAGLAAEDEAAKRLSAADALAAKEAEAAGRAAEERAEKARKAKAAAEAAKAKAAAEAVKAKAAAEAAKAKAAAERQAADVNRKRGSTVLRITKPGDISRIEDIRELFQSLPNDICFAADNVCALDTTKKCTGLLSESVEYFLRERKGLDPKKVQWAALVDRRATQGQPVKTWGPHTHAFALLYTSTLKRPWYTNAVKVIGTEGSDEGSEVWSYEEWMNAALAGWFGKTLGDKELLQRTDNPLGFAADEPHMATEIVALCGGGDLVTMESNHQGGALVSALQNQSLFLLR